MKRLPVCLATAMLLLAFIPMQLKAGTETNPAPLASTKTLESAEANALISRLNEIKAMDKSKMTSSVKKQLRKEVRTTKDRLSHIGGGVYISVGALILIILLLIILL